MKNITTLLLTLLIFGLNISCYSQSEYSVVCASKQAWLVNKAKAVLLGNCKNKNWITNLKFISEKDYAKHKQSKREKQVEMLFQGLGSIGNTPILLSQANLQHLIDKSKSNNQTLIVSETLLDSVQKLFQKEEMNEKTMEFLIVIGYGVIDPDTGKLESWNESSRYKVKVIGENPKIEEILEAAKRNIPEGEYLKNLKDYLYLRLFETNEKLNKDKTIKDYNIKEGAVFRLQSSVR